MEGGAPTDVPRAGPAEEKERRVASAGTAGVIVPLTTASHSWSRLSRGGPPPLLPEFYEHLRGGEVSSKGGDGYVGSLGGIGIVRDGRVFGRR